MPKRSPNLSGLYAVFCVAMLISCALAITAQSGRRGAKSPSVPVPTPEPTPTLSKPVEKPKAAFHFIIGMDRFDGYSQIPLYVSSSVLRSCAGRLDDAQSVEVLVENNDMGHAVAIQRAKKEKEAYVVWLQLEPNSLNGRAGPNDDPYNVSIEYTVIAPTTAKQVLSGRVFPGYRGRGVIVKPNTGGVNGDYQLNQAAKSAAERILDHFHIGTGTPHP